MASRLIVAAIGIAVIFAAISMRFADDLLFVGLITGAIVIAVAELIGMLKPMRPFVPAALICAVATPLLAWKADEAGLIAGVALALPMTLVFGAISAPRDEPLGAITATLFPVGYVVLAASTIILVRDFAHGTAIIWLMLAGTWMSDTAAFVGGKSFGKHKLAPRISPNKTIEGLACGLVFGTAIVWYGSLITGSEGKEWITGAEGVLLGIVIAIATVCGDLFESLVKRAAGTKDASHLLGDHGGMLDRLDALLLAGPATYVTIKLLEIA